MQEILIKSIMTAQVQCASPSTPLSHVIQSMKLSHHSCKVITENDRPIGMLTERDIVHHVTELVEKGKEHDPAVGSVMSAHPVTIHENATLFEALVVAKSNRIRHLPVINSQGHLVGVVTYTDLVAAHFQVIDKYTEILEAKSPPARRSCWRRTRNFATSPWKTVCSGSETAAPWKWISIIPTPPPLGIGVPMRLSSLTSTISSSTTITTAMQAGRQSLAASQRFS